MVAGNPAKFIGYSDVFYKRVKASNDVHCYGMSLEEKRQYLLSLPDSCFPQKPPIKIPDKQQ